MEPNPRKIKRFINLYNLLIKFKNQNIKSNRIDETKIDDNLLAKYLVIQFRWEEFFNDLIKYYNLTGSNLVKDLIDFEDRKSYEDRNPTSVHNRLQKSVEQNSSPNNNPLMKEYEKYLDVNYFGLRSYLKKEPILNGDLGAYIHLSQTTSIEENQTQRSNNSLIEAIESQDENERLEAINEIMLNFDNISNPDILLSNLIKDESWAVRSKAVWVVLKNQKMLKNYTKLIEIILNDKDPHVQRALKWAREVHNI